MLERAAVFDPSATPDGVRQRLAAAAAANDQFWPSNIGDVYRLKQTRSPDVWLRRVLPDLPSWPAEFELFRFAGWKPDETAQWLRWNEYHAFMTMVLQKVDRASMYHSLEVRVPLLDRDVVTLAQRVDWRSCLDVQRRIGKLPLRNALARHVPQQTAAKRGFTIPMAVWLRGPLKAVFEETLLNRRELCGLNIRQQALKELFDRHLSGKDDYSEGLWTLLSLALWHNRHYETRHHATVA